MTNEQLQAELTRLTAENEALKQKKVRPLLCKVAVKGGVSLYGVNSQFPITLYKDQWLRVLNHADQIRAFITENDSALSSKPVK
jgi:hypothetical protein